MHAWQGVSDTLCFLKVATLSPLPVLLLLLQGGTGGLTAATGSSPLVLLLMLPNVAGAESPESSCTRVLRGPRDCSLRHVAASTAEGDSGAAVLPAAAAPAPAAAAATTAASWFAMM